MAMGNQLLYLECKEYLGLDVSLTVLAQIRDKFNNDESKRLNYTMIILKLLN